MFARYISFLALAAISAMPAQSASAEPLQPTGKWHVDFADSQCVASRDYGSEGSPLFLVFKKPAIGDVLQIAVVQNGSVQEPNQLDGEVSFDNLPPIKTSILEYGVRKLKQRALMINLQTVDLAPMLRASTLRVRSILQKPERGTRIDSSGTQSDRTFSMRDTSTVIELLNECADDLQKVWNVWDENRDSVTLKRGPAGRLDILFSGKDYPAVAMRNNLSGTTTLVLLIDELGKVGDCTVTRTSGAASIDAQSCAIIRERGKFRPAIGLDGKPTKSSWKQSITWRLEG